MAGESVALSGHERFFQPDELIVSKTDPKGRILYANKVFIDISGYTEPELLGQPHRILRHPDMPHSVFKLLWDTIQSKKELFAYVVNRCKNGDHYWVLAHVTPSLDESGNVVGFHSNRRVPDPTLVKDVVAPLYKQLRDEERRHQNTKDGMDASARMLNGLLAEKGMEYDEFIFALKN